VALAAFEKAPQLPATYSGGMTRRLDIAMTLMGRPRLIFLDAAARTLPEGTRDDSAQHAIDLVKIKTLANERTADGRAHT
jgi:ABC-2 type transport system ATP-binding protein